MKKKDDKFAVVVAHPDDEILFASSIIDKASQIFICFSDIPGEDKISDILTKGRRNIIERYPLNNVTFLKVSQASNKDSLKNNWEKVIENEYGVKGGRNDREYKQNFQKLFKILSIELANFKKIYTHNPWGEYGHVEHIQIHRCVAKIRDIIGFEMFVFGYFSKDTISMASVKLKTLGPLFLKNKNNFKLFHKIRELYIEERCWTWSLFYTPPNFEFFYEFKGKNNFLSNPNKRKKLIYIYHPTYSRRIRCCEYSTDSFLFKIFIFQNKYLFRLRTFILNSFLRSLIKNISNFKKCILPQ